MKGRGRLDPPNATAADHQPESPAPSRAPSRASANTKAFWSLMEQWGIPDATALELIGFAGKIGKSGKRPSFRLNTQQVQLLEYLQELTDGPTPPISPSQRRATAAI